MPRRAQGQQDGCCDLIRYVELPGLCGGHLEVVTPMQSHLATATSPLRAFAQIEK